MSRKLYLRLLLLLGLLTLVLAPAFTSASPRSACTDCLRQCRTEYQHCVALGLAGCDEVQADCNASCPCP